MDSLLTIKQCAEKLNMSKWFVHASIRNKTLPVVRLSHRATRIRPADLAKFCDEHLQRGSRSNAEPVKS